MKLGNIIYIDELVNHDKVDYIQYTKYDISNIVPYDEIDLSLPKLYVGWNHLKEVNPIAELSILNKEIIKNKYYWEFSFNENKSQHVSGVDMFVRNVPYYYFREKYTYKNLDPIFNKFDDITSLDGYLHKKNIIQSNIESIYIYKSDMLYFLHENIIYGIDLNMYEYFNINKDDVINLITLDKTIENIDDIEGLEYQKQYKNFPNFEELKRYLVVLLSKA